MPTNVHNIAVKENTTICVDKKQNTQHTFGTQRLHRESLPGKITYRKLSIESKHTKSKWKNDFNLFIALEFYSPCCLFAHRLRSTARRCNRQKCQKLYDPHESEKIQLHLQKSKRLKNIFYYIAIPKKCFRFSASENIVAYSRSDSPDVFQPPSGHTVSIDFWLWIVPNQRMQ